MKYIATIVLAIALLSTHAVRDVEEADDLDFKEATARNALSSLGQRRVAAEGTTLSEFFANLRSNRARGRGCRDETPLRKEELPERWTKQLDFDNASCESQNRFFRFFLVPAKCDPTFSLALTEQKLERETVEKTDAVKERVKNEVQLMRDIKAAQVKNNNTEDRHIAAWHDHVWVQSHLYILMEVLPGEELLHILKKNQVSLMTKLALFAEALRGVARLHQLGFAHCDLRPESVVLTAEDTKGVRHAKVADFESTCKPKPDGLCYKKRWRPLYMAPESFEKHVSGFKPDVWAMGAMLYEVLFGLDTSPVVPCETGDKWLDDDGVKFDVENLTVFPVAGDFEYGEEKRIYGEYWLMCIQDLREPITIPKKAENTMEGNAFENVLRCMLKKAPAQRCSAQEALEHFKNAARGIGLPELIRDDYTDTAALPTCMERLDEAKPQTRRTSAALAVADSISGLCSGGLPCFRPS